MQARNLYCKVKLKDASVAVDIVDSGFLSQLYLPQTIINEVRFLRLQST
jgi:predicted aspartyl protease